MELLEHGGWVLLTIFVLSFSAWFVIVRKWLCLRAETRGGFDWIGPALSDLHSGSPADLRTACQDHPSLVGHVMLMALDALESGRDFSGRHRKRIIERETAQLRRHLDVIAAAGAVLPLLGLLGTVLGMTKTFEALTQQTAGETSAMMAGGISEALITTQAGLVAALPVVLLHGLLSSRVRRYVDECALAMKRLESAVRTGG